MPNPDQYMVIPFALVEQMPTDWLERFGKTVDELSDAFPTWRDYTSYAVVVVVETQPRHTDSPG